MEADDKIFEQISYYFSDANIKIDTYMQTLTGVTIQDRSEGSTYPLQPVAIDEFLKFTKLKTLISGDLSILERALNNGIAAGTIKYNTELLYDASLKTVTRKDPFVYRNTSGNVLFAELNLRTPFKASGEVFNFLQKVFQPFGEILSIRNTFLDEDSRGFYAFVEFQDFDTTEKAVDCFRSRKDSGYDAIEKVFLEHFPDDQKALEGFVVLTFDELNSRKNDYYKLKSMAKSLEVQLNNKLQKDEKEFQALFLPKVPKKSTKKPVEDPRKSTKRKAEDDDEIILEDSLPKGTILGFEIHSTNIESLDIKVIKQKFQRFLTENPGFQEYSSAVEYFHIDSGMLQITDYPNSTQRFYVRTLSEPFSEVAISRGFCDGFLGFFEEKSFTGISCRILDDSEKKDYWKSYQKVAKGFKK